MNELTQQELKKILRYNPDTGIFTWLINASRHITINDEAGSLDYLGYLIIGFRRRKYKAHRLAFLYMTGSFPKNQIDHINHIANDNRWSNLREVGNQENARNQKLSSRNKSGFNGVLQNKRNKKWMAKIVVDGAEIYLGCFTDINDAIAKRKEANIKYGFHHNHGKSQGK